MIADARSLAPNASLETQVCVVGGGAAGITLARELGTRGVPVLLLESGGFEYEAATQELYEGTESGDILEEDAAYLVGSRQRFLGGTTNHWDGWCRPLDAIDFEVRPWVEHSGWPITRTHLEPFYTRAARVLQIPDFDYLPEATRFEAGSPLLPGESEIGTTTFHISPPTRFGRVYRQELADSDAVKVLTHANAIALEAHPDGARIERLRAGTLEGKRFTVEARAYVLAAGGIENPRLLLVSNQVHSAGLGNHNDLVGRFFMDHPSQVESFLVVPDRLKGLDLYYVHHDRALGGRIQGVLRPGEESQRRRRLLNSVLGLFRPRGRDQPPLKWSMNRLAADLGRAGDGSPGSPDDDHLGRLQVASEQSPNPASRVTLGDDKDALGLARVRLDWRMKPEDLDSIRATLRLLARELGRFGLGRFYNREDAVRPWRLFGASYHHMGTTRMADDPERGVVDADCRVHGVGNLYLAGSSVFPTSGCSNPTLTLVALALRLADKLAASHG